MEIIIEIFGMVGAFLVLATFALNQFNKLTNDDIRYDAINLLAGIMLVIYGIYQGVIPFILINTVWSIIAFRDVVIYLRGKKR